MNHNKCIKEILPFLPIMEEAYDRIIFEYSKYCSAPLGYADCFVYAQALISGAKRKQMGLDDVIKSYSKNWHPHNRFFILCSFIDTFITLKLKHLDVLGAELDAAFEECKIKVGITSPIKFMYHIIIARLQLVLIDNETLKDSENQAWFSGCLEILKNLKIARKIAIIDDVHMPVQEAFVDMQIHVINMGMVEPSLKKGFSYDAINFLSFHHEVPKEVLRRAMEPNAFFLVSKYSREPLSKIITRPYNYDPKALLSL